MLEDDADVIDDIDRHVRGRDQQATTPTPGSFSMNRCPQSSRRETTPSKLARPYSQQRRPVFSTTPNSQSTPLSIIAALVATARI